MAVLLKFATDESNYEQVRQQILERTGFQFQVAEDFSLVALGTPESQAQIEESAGFTVFATEGVDTLPTLAAPEVQAGATDISPGQPVVGGVNGGEGGAETVPGIMGGGTLTKIARSGQDDLWAMTYNVGAIKHVYTFASFDAMESILGANPIQQGTYGFQVLTEQDLDRSDTWVLGDAAAFAGQDGTYQSYFDDVMREASLEAGIRNPGKLGEYLSDPDIQRIMAEGQAGGWSKERTQAEVRNTNYYQNVLYPGIDSILATGTPNPEREYQRYMSSVDPALEMLGYARDADGTFRSAVGEMLDKGIQANTFTQFAPTFVRAEQSQDFADVLNQWTQNDLGKSITFEDWFDVLDGTSSTEIDQVVEKASIQFAAERTSTILDEATITRLSELTNFTDAQLTAAFSQSEQQLLAIGNADLARFGLSQESLVNSAFNVETTGFDTLTSNNAPITAGEVGRRARKAQKELGLVDDNKASFFFGFNQSGAPVRTGLAAANPEAG